MAPTWNADLYEGALHEGRVRLAAPNCRSLSAAFRKPLGGWDRATPGEAPTDETGPCIRQPGQENALTVVWFQQNGLRAE